jgi:hypothetical protein
MATPPNQSLRYWIESTRYPTPGSPDRRLTGAWGRCRRGASTDPPAGCPPAPLPPFESRTRGQRFPDENPRRSGLNRGRNEREMAHGECGVRNSGVFYRDRERSWRGGEARSSRGDGKREAAGGLGLVLWWWKRRGGLYRRDREQTVDAAPVGFIQAAG